MRVGKTFLSLMYIYSRHTTNNITKPNNFTFTELSHNLAFLEIP